MIWSAVAFWRIAMARQDNLRPEFLSTNHGGIKIFDFEPQQDSIAGRQFRITDWAVMMIRVPAMQLQEQLAIRNQLFVLGSTVAAVASQKTLIPATACFDISNTNKRLWMHWLQL
jgi:hypothetical protein